MKRYLVLFLIVAFVASTLGCANMSNTEKGAATGAVAGGVIGGIIGHQTGNKTAGIIIGAAIGGMAGAYIGNYMDRQKQEIEETVPDAEVVTVNHEGEVVEENEKEEGQALMVTFNSNTLFDINSSALKPGAKANLDQLAVVMNKYEETNININGHTDATGSEEYNMKLSKERAQSVADYLGAQGVRSARFTVKGFGETLPIASNETPEGRQLNRRVDIVITPNEALIEEAKSQG